MIKPYFIAPLNASQPAGNDNQGFTLDLAATNADLRYDVSGVSKFNVQVNFLGGAASAVLTIYRSLDGVTPLALESAQTLSAATAASLMTTTIDAAGFAYCIVRCTTAESGKTASIFVFGKDLGGPYA